MLQLPEWPSVYQLLLSQALSQAHAAVEEAAAQAALARVLAIPRADRPPAISNAVAWADVDAQLPKAEKTILQQHHQRETVLRAEFDMLPKEGLSKKRFNVAKQEFNAQMRKLEDEPGVRAALRHRCDRYEAARELYLKTTRAEEKAEQDARNRMLTQKMNEERAAAAAAAGHVAETDPGVHYK